MAFRISAIRRVRWRDEINFRGFSMTGIEGQEVRRTFYLGPFPVLRSTDSQSQPLPQTQTALIQEIKLH